MSLAESIAERLSFKKYATGVIAAATEPVASSDPGASGAQQLRFVSHSLALQKADIQNNEKRTDRQAPLGRHGTRRVSGSISGLLSPGTYEEFMEAAMRGTWAAMISLSNTELTSLAADNTTSTLTAAGGDPVSLGLRIGDIIQLANMSDAENNGRNFMITGFSGTSNRVMAVYPAPDTMSADTAFTLVGQGASLVMPTSSHVSRKFAIEAYQQDIDVGELFTECRVGGFNIGVNADQNVTIEFPFMGRNRTWLSASTAPFFSSPTAATTLDICGPVGGLVRVNGVNRGVVTALSFSLNCNPQGPSVVGQTIVPEIFLGAASLTGNLSFFFEDSALLETFDSETRIEIIVMFANGTGIAAECLSFYMPYVQLGSVSKQDDGSGGMICSAPFSAGPYPGTAPTGGVTSLVRIVDTNVTP